MSDLETRIHSGIGRQIDSQALRSSSHECVAESCDLKPLHFKRLSLHPQLGLRACFSKGDGGEFDVDVLTAMSDPDVIARLPDGDLISMANLVELELGA